MAIYTWVPEFTQRSTPRRYFFVREDDRQLVARAETRWVFVDLTTGRRRPLPDDLLAAFERVPDEAEVRRVAGVEP
jgi:acyl-CoA thioester hydrolase